jgi:hypothetical protein
MDCKYDDQECYFYKDKKCNKDLHQKCLKEIDHTKKIKMDAKNYWDKLRKIK